MMRRELEADCLALAAEGVPEAQRMLYERYHHASFRLAYLLLRDGLDSEEVVQDAFVYAFENLHRYRRDRGAFWTWLRVILVSRCRNKRRRKRLAQVSLEMLEAVGQAPADSRARGDPVRASEKLATRQAVWEALQQVSPGARDALILRYYEGVSYAEMAQLLDCSRAAARSRVVHGKAQLRGLLAGPRAEQVRTRGAECPAGGR